ncbi:hypothetical protein [Deinococcus sp.]|uniref:hypothetical protein n=1 Tax=Deinococcus sp. TaxID=47478 RepID=UPI0025D8B1AA|nr:hypothetical protein [Deinococcus sp.]
MNPNPTKARQARRSKKRTQPGTLNDARALLWRALSRAGDLLDAEDAEGQPDTHTALRAIHAISQGAAAYARIIEVGELEARLAALEAVSSEPQPSGPQLGRGAA